MMPFDPMRALVAAGLLLAYAGLCIAIAVRERHKRQAGFLAHSRDEADTWIVAFASQTGTAEEIALQTAGMLSLAGLSSHACELSVLTMPVLRAAKRALFIVSTYGEGDPPDNAAAFVDGVMSDGNENQGDPLPPLSDLRYAVLALGNRTYQSYCGFGRHLDAWLLRQGATPLFERIDVDRGNRAAMLSWRQHLSHLVGTSDAPDWSGPPFSDWRLAERRLLNPGSAGEPVFHVELEPLQGAASWESGDLLQVLAPADLEHPREYSIASIPENGRVHLTVRLHKREDGTTGHASGWLGRGAAQGATVKARLRQHRRFRLEGNQHRPLILIGTGTGIAGLLAHLRARVSRGNGENWLIFGERNATRDFHYREEILGWQAAGMLKRVDTAFSRDRAEKRYVQHCLLDAASELRTWIERGAALYVCGSLVGMAGGVDDALRGILGQATLDELTASSRYRRDVY